MRRAAILVAGAALLCALATATSSAPNARAQAGLSTAQYKLFAVWVLPEDHVPRFPSTGGHWTAGRTVSYWGSLTNKSPSTSQRPPIGSYRATCVWLAQRYWPHSPKHKQDKRLSCTVVIALQAGPVPPGMLRAELNGFVLQGLVRRPRGDGELFATRYLRNLAVTGGTGEYKGAQGYADLTTASKISIYYALPVPPA